MNNQYEILFLNSTISYVLLKSYLKYIPFIRVRFFAFRTYIGKKFIHMTTQAYWIIYGFALSYVSQLTRDGIA